MLTSVRVLASIVVDSKAHVFWDDNIAFKLDCFVCRRADRTVLVERGGAQGRCVSERRPPGDLPPGVYTFDQVSYLHPAPIHVAGFDWWHERHPEIGQRLWLRCRLDFWWAPFQDRKDDTQAVAPARHPWVSLSYHVGCHACREAGHTDALTTPGVTGFGSNGIFPHSVACPTCGRTLVVANEPPEITLSPA